MKVSIYDYFKKTKDIYDLAYRCYLFLIKNNKNWFDFYINYIDCKNSKQIESDKKAIKELPDKLRSIIVESCAFDIFSYKSVVIEICQKLKKIKFSNNICLDMRDSIIAYCLLIGIDTEEKHRLENTSESMFPHDMGPLGSNNTAYGLYLRYRPVFFNCSDKDARIIDRVSYNTKKPNNSDFKPELSLHDYSKMLKVFLFVKKSELEINGLPHLKKLPKTFFVYNKPSTIQNINKSNKLSIAICTLSNIQSFNLGEKEYIEYPDDISKIQQIYKSAITEACSQGVNFIIFPEYTFSPKLYKFLFSKENKNFISKVREDSNLLCIFAGSTWTTKNQNIMNIFIPPKIRTLYSKYVPYIDPVDKRRIEPLNNKNVYCTLLYIPGIGYILPSVCRDIIGNYTNNIAQYFNPAFIFVSAHSNSVEGFNRGTENLTSLYHSSSVLCNDCSARKIGENEISYVTCPVFTKGGEPKEKKIPIKRSNLCTQCGNQSLGCIFVVNYSFSEQNVVDTKQIVLPK
jgi:hypothetical protein